MQAIRMPGFSAKELDEIDRHAMDAGILDASDSKVAAILNSYLMADCGRRGHIWGHRTGSETDRLKSNEYQGQEMIMRKTALMSISALLIMGGGMLAQANADPFASAVDAGMFNTGTGGVNGRTMADIRTGQTGIAETPRSSPVSPSSSVSSTASAQEQAGLHNNGAGGVNGLTAAEIRTGITQPRPMPEVASSSTRANTAWAFEHAGMYNNGAGGVNGLTAAEIRTGQTGLNHAAPADARNTVPGSQSASGNG
jgi:hypothetical protein